MRVFIVLSFAAGLAGCSSQSELKCQQFYIDANDQAHFKWANVRISDDGKLVDLSFPESGKKYEFIDGTEFSVSGTKAVARIVVDEKQIAFGQKVDAPAQFINRIDRMTGEAVLLGEGFYKCERGLAETPKPKF